MTAWRIHLNPDYSLSHSSYGDSLVEVTGHGGMEGEGVVTLFSLGPVSTPNTNDNYCTSLTVKKQSIVQSDQVPYRQ